MKTYRYRIYPNKQQTDAILRTVGCVRYVYNGLLADYKAQYYNWKLLNINKPKDEQSKCSIKLKEVTFLKQSAPFLAEVDSLALANAKLNLKTALKNFFSSRKGKRKGSKMGFPSFHKKNKSKSIYKTNNQGNNIRFVGNGIKLPKIGIVKVRLHRPCYGNIRSVSIEASKNGNYYIAILTDAISETISNDKKLDNLNIVGIDMSYSEFCVDSDNNDITDDMKPKYIRWYRKTEKKRKRLCRNLSRKTNGSSNKEKARIRLAILDAHVSNRRKDFCHKMSHYYSTHYDAIVLEDLNMQDMAKHGLRGHSKSVNDLGFGMFKTYLSYKCKERDKLLIYADKWFASSKTCRFCGEKNPKLKLSEREWECPHCGSHIERDYNSACNLREYFRSIIVSNFIEKR